MSDHSALEAALSVIRASFEPLRGELEARGESWQLLVSGPGGLDFGHVELSRPSQPGTDRMLWGAVEVRIADTGLEVEAFVEEWLDADDQSNWIASLKTSTLVGAPSAEFIAGLVEWVRATLLDQLAA